MWKQWKHVFLVAVVFHQNLENKVYTYHSGCLGFCSLLRPLLSDSAFHMQEVYTESKGFSLAMCFLAVLNVSKYCENALPHLLYIWHYSLECCSGCLHVMLLWMIIGISSDTYIVKNRLTNFNLLNLLVGNFNVEKSIFLQFPILANGEIYLGRARSSCLC